MRTNPFWGSWDIEWEDRRDIADRLGLPYIPEKKRDIDTVQRETTFSEGFLGYLQEKKIEGIISKKAPKKSISELEKVSIG